MASTALEHCHTIARGTHLQNNTQNQIFTQYSLETIRELGLVVVEDFDGLVFCRLDFFFSTFLSARCWPTFTLPGPRPGSECSNICRRCPCRSTSCLGMMNTILYWPRGAIQAPRSPPISGDWKLQLDRISGEESWLVEQRKYFD
jgi:hypothetical protein